jgi:hypothetical protein
MISQTTKRLQHAGIVFCSIVLTLFAAEWGVRLSGVWKLVSYDDQNYFAPAEIPEVPYKLKPNVRTTWADADIISNSEGIRSEREFGPKRGDTFRVLAIGDSITFGMGVGQADAYPNQLEYLLNGYKKNARLYEVINAGISGFNAADEANFLSYLMERYHPDLIVWLLIQNDYDDSLGVTADGRLTYAIPDYVVTSSWLEQTWGVKGGGVDPDNFLNSMDEAHQFWALGKPLDGRLGAVAAVIFPVERNSYLFGFLKNRLKSFQIKSSADVPPHENFIPRYIPVKLPDGTDDFLPEISSLFVSPFYTERFAAAVRKGIDSASSKNIPLLVLGIDVLLDFSKPGPDKKIIIDDVSAYLGMPVFQFKRLYNLGWDPHLNKKGNRLLADSVVQALVENSLVDLDPYEKRGRFDRTVYWDTYKKALRDYQDSLNSFIDFKRFQNIHQVVGGLYPPCIFPIKDGAKLSLVLIGADGKNLRISGFNKGIEQELKVWIYDGRLSISRNFSIHSGQFDFEINLPKDVIEKRSVVDVQLSCVSTACGEIKLEYIGFTSDYL